MKKAIIISCLLALALCISGFMFIGGKPADSGFTPSGTPAGHWSADTITGLEDGDPVATWPDQSGNSSDLVQATPTNRPSYQTNEQNSLPIVRFDGNDNYMDYALPEAAQPNTIFVAGGYVTTAHGDRIFSSTGADTKRHILYNVSSFYNIYAGVTVVGPTAATGFKVYSTLFNGASSYLRINTDETTGNVGAFPLDGFRLGASNAGSGFGELDIGEVILYTTDEAYADNESGLNTKWAIY